MAQLVGFGVDGLVEVLLEEANEVNAVEGGEGVLVYDDGWDVVSKCIDEEK